MSGEDKGEGGEELKMKVIEDYFSLVWLKVVGEGQGESFLFYCIQDRQSCVKQAPCM